MIASGKGNGGRGIYKNIEHHHNVVFISLGGGGGGGDL